MATFHEWWRNRTPKENEEPHQLARDAWEASRGNLTDEHFETIRSALTVYGEMLNGEKLSELPDTLKGKIIRREESLMVDIRQKLLR